MLYIKLHRNIKIITVFVLLLFFGFLLFSSVCYIPCDREHGPVKLRDIESPEVKKYSTFVAVLILTGPRYFERRDTIRETWLANHDSEVVKAYFAIGTTGLTTEELGTLTYENSKHGDLLLLPELYDSYYNLTEKVVQSITWLDSRVDFKYLFKADDDTFARMDVLISELRHKQPKRLYWGFFDGRARVKTRGQWAETNFKLCDHYLPHARGGGYILSADLVHFIASNADLLQKFNSEDISVGTWLAPLHIHRYK